MNRRNRKILQNSDSLNGGELPTYTNGGTSGNGGLLTNSTSTATARQRRMRSKRNSSVSSSIGIVCGFFLLSSLCIITVQHLGRSSFSSSNQDSPHRFLVNAAANTDNAPPSTIYDIAILGAGPAGLTAGIFGARAGLDVVILGSQAGLLAETPRLENFPGYHGNQKLVGTGEEWLKSTRNQARELGANFALPGLLASSLEVQSGPDDPRFAIHTQLGIFQARSVIVATGATSRKLNLEYEPELWGRHLHNCAICDGPMYKDKTVVVVGGGDAAIDAAIYLSRQTKRVILVHRQNTFDKVKAQSSLTLVRETSNIDIYTPHVVIEWNTETINGDLMLTGVTIQNQSDQERILIACDGAFLMIGATPNTEWLYKTLLVDDHGLIQLGGDDETSTTSGMVSATSLLGVFAAGEVVDAQYKQAITAAAEGAQAALDAERWLRSQHENTAQRVSAGKIAARRDEKEPEPEPQPESKDDTGDDCDLTKQDCINHIVHKYPVVVFSKPWCPYCRKALEALAIEGVANPYVIDLSKHPNTSAIQSTLASMTGGRRTVPNVFVGGTSIGGGDETVNLQAARKLNGLLVQAGALKAKKVEVSKSVVDLGPPPNRNYGCDLGTEDCITQIVNKYPLVLFSLSWCPECHRMLELLATVGIQHPHIIDLDDYKRNGTSKKIRATLVQKAKSNQVPSLFVGGEALGRHYNVLQLNRSGQLVPKLQAAGLL
eukprot:scaffold192_cov114-Cylindrotheca_fusiformis.AAC.6